MLSTVSLICQPLSSGSVIKAGNPAASRGGLVPFPTTPHCPPHTLIPQFPGTLPSQRRRGSDGCSLKLGFPPPVALLPQLVAHSSFQGVVDANPTRPGGFLNTGVILFIARHCVSRKVTGPLSDSITKDLVNCLSSGSVAVKLVGCAI